MMKLDFSKGENQECIVATSFYGSDCYGGKPFIVAREPVNPEADEDDGYVVSYVHDEKTRESNFWVTDAKSSDLHVVAVVKLPRLVPSCFHGIFVKESDLCKLHNC
ncbi:putative 9-cis-epoxycarotenoid dioxygenase [Melia azedarach]|uniref:9-cis-epoxycarotenoid dioxygenase n=1 Tax=Melia azedarach TaxID=155640 RepID=A0ACC1X953_MELAZ|nr:putative 9-cis-epoxycarotenoid dioxygenase [Melia azedarach]